MGEGSTIGRARNPKVLAKKAVSATFSPNCVFWVPLPVEKLRFSALNYRECPPPLWRRFFWQGRGNSECSVHELRDGPSLISDAKGLCWRRAESFMGTAEIVVRDVWGDGGAMVIQLF